MPDMRALILSEEIADAIAEAIERARAKPLSLEDVMRQAHGIPQTRHLALADRAPGYVSEAKPEQVMIPNGYRAAISFEHQPAGLCAHLSISVDRPGRMPSPTAVEMIAAAFGLIVPLDDKRDRIWTEEFDPGHHAVNIVQPIWPAK